MTDTAPPAPPTTPLPAVTVRALELYAVELPLVVPFTTSFGRQVSREVVLLRVVTDTAEGVGELTTPPAPVYSEEFTAGARLVLAEHLVPRLLTPDRELTAERVGARLAAVHGHRMARAAVETAVLDAQLRTVGRSLAGYLGAVRDRVPAGVSVGIPDGGVPELVEQVRSYLDAGYVRIKAKIQPGFDHAAIAELRSAVGDDVPLQVDANAAYDPDDPAHLAALDGLDELGLTLLEQPFAPDRLKDHARHAARWSTPVCLDESIHDRFRARDAIRCGATSVVNIKLGRVGGVLESVAIHDLCRDAGVPVWCGGMLESGIGRAANLALAALEGFTLPGDVSASDRYWREDLTEPFVLERDGHVAVPDGPGIGRSPRPDMLADAEVTRLDR